MGVDVGGSKRDHHGNSMIVSPKGEVLAEASATADDIALADTVVTVPLNPAFSSLNLAQAVLLIGYEWFTARTEPRPATMHRGHSRAANKEELLRFFDHFEEALVESGFLRHADKRPSMTRNLRNLFQRAECTEQELRTLHGVITAFLGPRKRPAAERDDADI